MRYTSQGGVSLGDFVRLDSHRGAKRYGRVDRVTPGGSLLSNLTVKWLDDDTFTTLGIRRVKVVKEAEVVACSKRLPIPGGSGIGVGSVVKYKRPQHGLWQDPWRDGIGIVTGIEDLNGYRILEDLRARVRWLKGSMRETCVFLRHLQQPNPIETLAALEERP